MFANSIQLLLLVRFEFELAEVIQLILLIHFTKISRYRLEFVAMNLYYLQDKNEVVSLNSFPH